MSILWSISFLSSKRTIVTMNSCYLSQIVSSKSQSNSKFGISTRVMEKYVRQFPSIYFGLSLASVIQQIVIFNSERVLLRVFSSVQIIKSTK